MADGFLHKLIDWKNFELFVKDLYSSEGEVLVEHNVVEKCKSGATRQIDVKVTQKTKLHTYVTIIECKCWKKAVSRATIDVLASSIEDLNASKGVIFTTKGYQKGAETYARSKNIDIFVVRDLLDEEWGLPGRNIHLFLEIVSGQMSKIHFPNARALLIVEKKPEKLGIEIELNKESYDDDSLILHSVVDGRQGPNISKILFELHAELTRIIDSSFKRDLTKKEQNTVITSDVLVNFLSFEYRQMRNQYAAVNFEKLELGFVTQISKSELVFDRGDKFDYAFVVQNYISDTSNYVYKSKKEDGVVICPVERECQDIFDKKDVFVNGSTLKVFTAPWVGVDASKANNVAKTSPIHIEILVDDNPLGFRFQLIPMKG